MKRCYAQFPGLIRSLLNIVSETVLTAHFVTYRQQGLALTWSRPRIVTLAPSFNTSAATAFPIPLEPPVI